MDSQNDEKSGVQPEEDFTFIKEKIKDKPLNKKRLLIRAAMTVGMAVLFGLVAAATYTISNHHMDDILYPKNTQIKIPSEDEIKEVSENSASENSTSENEAEKEEEERPSAQVINNIVEKVSMSLEDYEELYASLNQIAVDAENSMVNVTGVSSDVDWFQNTYENKNQSAGLIVADNGKQLLILVNKSVTEKAQSIRVEFSDGMMAKAEVKKYDVNTGLAIIGVDLETIDDATRAQITMAKLGSSKSPSLVGKPVIAIGSPLGTQNSVAYGLITSTWDTRQLTDSDTHVITTDIYGSKSGSGVIVNLEGEVLGIITQNYVSTDTANLINALSISDMKETIEKLMNGQDRALFGINGTDVTAEAIDEYGIPVGAYVTGIIMDSPAMEAGIQSGDVITKFGTTEITSFTDFKTAMEKSQPEDTTVITIKRYAKGEYTDMNFEVTLGKLE